RDGKGSTWEGGMRVPGIFWWPGKIGPGAVRRQVASTMDLFATLHRLAGVELPSGRTLDSHDLSPLLFADGASTRQSLFYYRGQRLMAVRHGPWKAHLFTQPAYGPGSRTATPHDPPLLYNLDEDPSEQYDVAQQHADVVEAIRAAIAVHLAGLKPAPSQLENP
ncbi:MAG: sulfatase-like hydrolase/transferase, partial [Pirellulales bacterium]